MITRLPVFHESNGSVYLTETSEPMVMQRPDAALIAGAMNRAVDMTREYLMAEVISDLRKYLYVYPDLSDEARNNCYMTITGLFRAIGHIAGIGTDTLVVRHYLEERRGITIPFRKEEHHEAQENEDREADRA